MLGRCDVSVRVSSAVAVAPHDHAGIVDSAGVAARRAGEVDLLECPVRVAQESVLWCERILWIEDSDNLRLVIDPPAGGGKGVREVEVHPLMIAEQEGADEGRTHLASQFNLIVERIHRGVIGAGELDGAILVGAKTQETVDVAGSVKVDPT